MDASQVRMKIRGAIVGYSGEAWAKVSPTAKELVRELMRVDWSRRLTAEQVRAACAQQARACTNCRGR